MSPLLYHAGGLDPSASTIVLNSVEYEATSITARMQRYVLAPSASALFPLHLHPPASLVARRSDCLMAECRSIRESIAYKNEVSHYPDEGKPPET
eukprot:scaffold239006_cov32-Tisochrysis_lutea.AAC.2